MNSFPKKTFSVLLCIFVCAAMFAQTKTITVGIENGNLKTLLELIEKQSDYVFSYRDDVVDNKVITVDVKNAPVSQVLDKVLAGTNLSYKIVSDKSIIITETTDNKQHSKESKITVSGNVVDSTGEPIIGGTVRVKGSQVGTATDIDGNYTLNNIPSDATLIFSYIG